MPQSVGANLLARRLLRCSFRTPREQVRSYRAATISICRSRLVGEAVVAVFHSGRLANKFAPTGQQRSQSVGANLLARRSKGRNQLLFTPQPFTNFNDASVYRSPAIALTGNKSFSALSSSALNLISSAATFSCRYLRCLVPGIGTTSLP